MDDKKIKRLDEIEDEAIGAYLDKTDFDISDWIADEDKKEWRELKIEINGECPTCGNIPKDCECDISVVDTTDGIGKEIK